MIDSPEFIDARECAANYLSYRMRSEHEVLNKLKVKGYGAVAEDVVALLKRYDYVNDVKYCMAYISEKMKLGNYGRIRIAHELRRRGVSNDDIDGAYARYVSRLSEEEGSDLQEIEYEKAMAALRKQYGSDVQNAGRKVYAFLLRRGFNADTIRRCLSAEVYDED